AAFGAELRRGRELRVIDVAGDDAFDAFLAQHRDADQAEPAAAEHRDFVLRAHRRQLAGRAVRGERRAGERRGKAVLDAADVDQVFRIRHQHMRGIRAGAVDAEEARAGDAVIFLTGLAHGALAAADPRIDQPLLADFDPASAGPERFDDAERLVAEREGRNAAALLHVEALAAAEIEVALPDVEIGVADAGARDAHEHLGSLGLGRAREHLLQRLAVFDDLIADHAFAASLSAWSMSQRMSSSVSMPTDMRTMSGVTPALRRSASSICRCVVEAGWITSVFASPMFARWLMNCAASMKRSPALAPPLTPKLRSPEAPCGRYFFASEKYLLSGSPG